MSTTTQVPGTESADSHLDSMSDARRPAAAEVWKSRLLSRRGLVAIGVVGAAVTVFGALYALSGGLSAEDESLVYYTAARMDMPITITERGSLESQENVEIACEIENLGGDRGGIDGIRILSIVPNGSFVSEGDLLVELDRGPLQDRLDTQILATERARSEQIQATVLYENQITQNETRMAEAQLDVELARLNLEMYEDQETGTYQLQLQNLDLEIQEAKNTIMAAEAQLLVQSIDLAGIRMLYSRGYRSQGDVRQAEIAQLREEGNKLKAANQLATLLANRRQLEEYEYQMQQMQLSGSLATAERRLEQVQRDNESELAQALAAKDAADRALAKEEERLARYQEMFEKCRIYAPQDGMVAYATSQSRYRSSEVIEEGAMVRERQKILNLPSLTKMQVQTRVHESVLDQVDEGLPVTVRLESVPDTTFPGTVATVAVMPEQGSWLSSGTKVYRTIVTLDGEVEGLKPGMTAVATIHVDYLRDVIAVPVQAIVEFGQQQWCYVGTRRGPERRAVVVGRTNDKYVEIVEGIKEGERVVLNPMAIFDEERSAASLEDGEDELEPIDPQDGAQDGADDADEGGSERPRRGPEGDQDRESRGGGPGAGGPGAGRPGFGGRTRPGGEGAGGEEASGERTERRPGGGFNLMQMDANGDGKLSRDELPERMRPFLDQLDSNGDGELDSGEVEALRSRGRGGSGGGGAGGGRGGDRSESGQPETAA